MTSQRLADLIFAYEIATQTPDVSGAEHLDMLLIRSDLAHYQSQLSDAQKIMSTTLTADLLQDNIAMSVANAMILANKKATELGINIVNSIVTITQ